MTQHFWQNSLPIHNRRQKAEQREEFSKQLRIIPTFHGKICRQSATTFKNRQ
jgi:hypothetical protein